MEYWDKRRENTLATTQDAASPIECYTHNLTLLAQQGVFSPLAGHETVTDRMFQILKRDNKHNPALLADDESRRWAVVGEVARRIAGGDAPDLLAGRQIIALDYEALFADLADEALFREERNRQAQALVQEK